MPHCPAAWGAPAGGSESSPCGLGVATQPSEFVVQGILQLLGAGVLAEHAGILPLRASHSLNLFFFPTTNGVGNNDVYIKELSDQRT